MFLVQETSPTKSLKIGTATVQTSPAPLTNSSVFLNRGLLLRADGNNSDDILIGLNSGNTWPLSPGGSLDLPIDDASLLYVSSNTPG